MPKLSEEIELCPVGVSGLFLHGEPQGTVTEEPSINMAVLLPDRLLCRPWE